MDIYEYAESINYNADYYDFHTGRIYKIQEYGQAMRTMNTTEDTETYNAAKEVVDRGIAVIEDGNLIGYARRKKTT